MAASNAFKRLLLRRIAYGADLRGKSLLDRIREVAFAKIDVLRDGKVLVQTSSGNRSSTIQILSGQGVTPSEVAEALEILIGLHGEVLSALTSASVTATDGVIEQEMIYRLPSITETSGCDFRDISSPMFADSTA